MYDFLYKIYDFLVNILHISCNELKNDELSGFVGFFGIILLYINQKLKRSVELLRVCCQLIHLI